MLGGALVFSRGSKSERHLRKKINPAVTHSAVTDPANSRHLKKSLEARHLPGEGIEGIEGLLAHPASAGIFLIFRYWRGLYT